MSDLYGAFPLEKSMQYSFLVEVLNILGRMSKRFQIKSLREVFIIWYNTALTKKCNLEHLHFSLSEMDTEILLHFETLNV